MRWNEPSYMCREISLFLDHLVSNPRPDVVGQEHDRCDGAVQLAVVEHENAGQVVHVFLSRHGMVHHGAQQHADDVHADALLVFLHEHAAQPLLHGRIAPAFFAQARVGP